MTGFARHRATTSAGEVVVTIKSVNHRGLDIHAHLPVEFDVYEIPLRLAVKKVVARGHVDLRISVVAPQRTAPLVLNRPLLEAYLAALAEAAAAYNIQCEPDLNAAFRISGMLTQANGDEAPKELEAELVAAVNEALVRLNEFREREGRETAQLLVDCCKSIQADAEEMDRLRQVAVPAFRTRLQERLEEMLRGASIEAHRLVQEAAILADRSDIAEEIARLRVHAQELASLLNSGGEIGKKLDFLLQEMNRESNTILSKTNGVGETGLAITECALNAKSKIEKIREQALNLE